MQNVLVSLCSSIGICPVRSAYTFMNTPHIEFLGWDRPAIESVAEKLLEKLTDPATAPLYRRAVIVVPTQESGRRLREFMAEKAGRPILMPRVVLVGQLLPTEGNGVATEEETLVAWLQVLGADGEDPVERYAPLIPRRPDTHRERWAVGVAHKLMALRRRLEQEEITPDEVTHRLRNRKEAIDRELGGLSAASDSRQNELKARSSVYADEQTRWSKLGELFCEVDRLIGKTTVSQMQADWMKAPTWSGQSRLMILACMPELSPQLRTVLRNLNGRDGGRVEIWVHAEKKDARRFDGFGMPVVKYWADCDIEIPDFYIHMVDDAEAVAAEACRLAGGCNSGEVVIATGDKTYEPALIGAFAAQNEAWQFRSPEGRSFLTTDVGNLPGQLADYCSAYQDFYSTVTENAGMREMDAFLALLNNRTLQQVLQADGTVQTGIQRHSERIREVLLPASVRRFCHFLNPEVPLPGKDYRDLEYLSLSRCPEYYDFAVKVADFAEKCCNGDTLPEALGDLADGLPLCYGEEPLEGAVRSLCQTIKQLLSEPFRRNIRNPRLILEILRRRTKDDCSALKAAAGDTAMVGYVQGWRELTFSTGRRIIIAAMHEGCIPEPVPEDEFLPESLCRELGIRDEKAFRAARDAYLLTALLHSRKSDDVQFLVSRQNPDGTPVAPSSLLLRCGAELPERARKLFAESSEVSAQPLVPLCPLRQAKPGPEQDGIIVPGMMESIEQLTPPVPNPFADGNKTYSPSRLSGFLQCPLTFWLKNLFGLDAGSVYNEDKSEPESNECGTLVHAVLKRVVEALPDSEKLRAIFPEAGDEKSLSAALTQYARQIAAEEWAKLYMVGIDRGVQPLPLENQLRNIETILQEFALRHVRDLQEGWHNVCCERSLEPVLTLSDGTTVRFSMTADRIDFNERESRWRIIDYKTSSTAKEPLKQHLDEVPEGEASFFSRFMNAGNYHFPLVEAKCNSGLKYYRWKDVQLMLYAFGLRQLNAEDLASELPDVPLAGVMPDLCYYNLQTKTQRMECSYLLKNGVVSNAPGRGKRVICLTPEELLENAMKTVDSAIRMIRAGQCLFSAEALRFKTDPYSKLRGENKNAPRFGAISQQRDPRSMFNLPKLKISETSALSHV